MASILTNSSAMTALQNLNNTSKSLQLTQERISSGMRVASASDNAAYWSIATTMKSDNNALSGVKDALGLGAATIDVASAGINTSKDLVDQIKTKLVAAREPGIDRVKIQSEVSELQKQLRSVSDSAVFSGENWLSVDSAAAGYNASKSVVASFTRVAGAVSVGTISIDTSATKLYDANGAAGIIDKSRTVGTTTAALATMDISTLTDSTTDQQKLTDYITMADNAFSEITSAATNLGAVKSRVTLQQDFVSNLMGAITKGIGGLVDADMNYESTRLQALQVQQQLGVQALSISNGNSQTILSLFRG